MKRQGIAQKAVAAGLGLAMALGSIAPSVAIADSGGDTSLYVVADDQGITTPEGAEDENIKVVIPVAISYVADTQGNLTGPSDGTVAIKNNTQLGSVHVSKIQVTPEENVTLATTAAAANEDDEVYLTMTPGSGNAISLANFQTEAAPRSDQWDIAQASELELNGLTGKIGGFDELDPATKSKLATVHWTVAAGTAVQAQQAASRFVIHRVIPGGSLPDIVITSQSPNQDVGAGYTWKTAGGTSVPGTGYAQNAAPAGATEITLYGTPTS